MKTSPRCMSIASPAPRKSRASRLPLDWRSTASACSWNFTVMERAAATLSEAVLLLQAAGNDVLAAWAQADLADILIWRGELEAGIPMLDEALARLRQLRSGWL